MTYAGFRYPLAPSGGTAVVLALRIETGRECPHHSRPEASGKTRALTAPRRGLHNVASFCSTCQYEVVLGARRPA